MPELPEVETTVRALGHLLEGRRITALKTNREGLRRPFPQDLVQTMVGAKVIGLSRRAKYGIITTDRDCQMIFHLGMSGRWRINPQSPDRHDHLLLTSDKGDVLALNDPRRFGSVDLVSAGDEAIFAPFAALGPEPLGDDLTPDYLHKALSKSKAPVKALLLDQRVVAGLGNIYVCEALHRCGIAPTRPGNRVSSDEVARLVDAIRAILLAAIAAGGSSLRDFRAPDGKLGYFSHQFAVYDRKGELCGCGGTIERIAQSGRSSFYCPDCQS